MLAGGVKLDTRYSTGTFTNPYSAYQFKGMYFYTIKNGENCSVPVYSAKSIHFGPFSKVVVSFVSINMPTEFWIRIRDTNASQTILKSALAYSTGSTGLQTLEIDVSAINQQAFFFMSAKARSDSNPHGEIIVTKIEFVK